MSKTPNYDVKIKAFLDAAHPSERICALTGEKWMMTDEEIGWYKKFNVPPSKVAPRTRWLHHANWYVGYQFWYQKHPKTGKPLVCTVHPATGLKVLPDDEWFTQEFLEKGMDYKPDAPFFEQWRALELSVPFPASRNHVPPKNSIAFVSQGDEDSFFVGAGQTKRCFYTHILTLGEDSAEVYLSDRVQGSYHVVRSDKIFNSKYMLECRDCLNSAFCFDCRNCEFCFLASNKRNKRYMWGNEQLSREAWEKKFSEIDFGSKQKVVAMEETFDAFMKEHAVWPENFNEQVVDSSGEYLTRTTRVKEGYACGGGGSVDLYGCHFAIGECQGNAFCGYPVWASDLYYCGSCSRGSGHKFCFLTIQSTECEYCLLCYNCENCFGCIGLQRKKFCIFNKQYTEEEYWRRVDELKCAMLSRGEYGEFFPVAYSPSYFGEAGAIPWFGATRNECLAMGSLDFDPESMDAIGQDLARANNPKDVSLLPDHIDDLQDAWGNAPLVDPVNGRRFALIKPEIEFYRRMRLAPPRKHYLRRMADLYAQVNMGKFEKSQCKVCQREVRVACNAAYPARRIYCRSCYLVYLEKNG